MAANILPLHNQWGTVRLTREEIEQDFAGVPHAMIAIALGPGRGPEATALMDIEIDDLDGSLGGLLSRAKLLGDNPPETLGWKSRKGDHLLFTYDPRRVDEILGEDRGCKPSPPLPGLEVRLGTTHGNLKSLCPPTEKDNFRREWTGPRSIAEVPGCFYDNLAKLFPRREWEEDEDGRDDDLHKLFADRSRAQRYFDAVVARWAEEIYDAVDGTVADTIYKAALVIGGYLHFDEYLTPDAAGNVLMEAVQRRGAEESKSYETIKNGFRDGQKRPLRWPKALLDDEPKAGFAESAIVADDGWPALRLGKLRDVLPFPLAILPGPLPHFCDAVANAISGIDPGMVATHLLTIAGGIMGRSVELRLGERRYASACLFTGIVGPPGRARRRRWST